MRSGVLSVAAVLCAASASGQTEISDVGGANALSTVAQRHMVQVERGPGERTWLLSVQRDAYWSPDPEGLHWYRSDDQGASWRYYAQIFQDGIRDKELHLTTDVVARGRDVAVVWSYDTTETGFPSDAEDPNRKVYFQWWRYDGRSDWIPGPRITVASPASGYAYHRAELAFDSLGRIWIQAWLRAPCSSSAGANCSDTLRLWVSQDDGATFQQQPDLLTQPMLGGGRLISLGTKLMILWGDYSWDNPARYVIRDDRAPIGAWQGPFNAFAGGDSIYHGAALNAVADGRGGLHVVYKDRYENLYYRHFDGTAFGARQFVDSSGSGDWALQPAITAHGDELYVCTNHTVISGSRNELRAWRLSDGFSTWTVLDSAANQKLYPTAIDRLASDATSIPCAYVVGWWPGKLRVAMLPVKATPVPDAGTPDGGTSDAGTPDAGATDAGTIDAGVVDAGASDGGTVDAGTNDAGSPDAGAPDAGTSDAGVVDAGTPDAGMSDAGTPDAGTSDAGTSDAGTPDAGTSDAGTLAPLSTFTDPWQGPALDPSLWRLRTDTAGSSASVGSGLLTLQLEANSGTSGVHVTSREAWRLTGSSVHVRVRSVLDAGALGTQRLTVAPGEFSAAHVGFWYERGKLYLTRSSGGSTSFLRSYKFSSTAHAWWRIRERGGTTYWEVSSTGTSWSVLHSVPTSSLGFDPASVRLRFDVKAYGGSSAPGQARFSDLNR